LDWRNCKGIRVKESQLIQVYDEVAEEDGFDGVSSVGNHCDVYLISGIVDKRLLEIEVENP
jgi:hypothetical protein